MVLQDERSKSVRESERLLGNYQVRLAGGVSFANKICMTDVIVLFSSIFFLSALLLLLI